MGRSETTIEKINRLMAELGRATVGPGRVYLTGGATAVLIGWREATVDVDLKADPEPGKFFEAIARLKDQLDVNIELAAPDQFIPPLPGWRERSRPIGRRGALAFYHYDFYAQALSKIERGHRRDLLDVEQMIRRRLIDLGELPRLFDAIRPELLRYPAIDPESFSERVAAMIGWAQEARSEGD